MKGVPTAPKGFVSRIRARIGHDHSLFVRLFVDHPILLIPGSIIYVIVTALNFGLAAGLFLLAGLIAPHVAPADRVEVLQFILAGMYFITTEIALWLHYIYVGVRCFVSVAEFHGYSKPILRVVQLLFITIVIFAILHYYIALFSRTPAYHGINPIAEDQQLWIDNMGRLWFVPSWDDVINCLYFSTVTMATVGYGDIYPVSRIAKLATMAQIGVSFVLIVVILGWAIGNARELASARPIKDDNKSPSWPD